MCIYTHAQTRSTTCAAMQAVHVVLQCFHPAAAKRAIIIDSENYPSKPKITKKKLGANLTIFHAAMAMRYRQLGLGTGQVDLGL